MRKNNNEKSLQGQKRAIKNKARINRRFAKLDNHVNWLETMARAGVQIDLQRIIYDKDGVMRSQQDVRYIISRLVSRSVHKLPVRAGKQEE
jgi:hypothetical protein